MLEEKLRGHLVRAIEKVGLAEHRDALLEEARECVHFFYTKAKASLPAGSSKVGGLPDLPDSIEWPAGSDDDGNPRGYAEFLAQFDLADLPAQADVGLPRAGHLWLFVKNTSLTAPPVAVYYYDGKEALEARTKPESSDPEPEYGWRDLEPMALKFERGISLPLSSHTFQRRFKDMGDEFEELREQLAPGLDNYGSHDGIDGQIGGYSYQAEFDLAREYAIVELGHPEYANDDSWESVEELEEQIKAGLPFPRITPDKQEAYRSGLRKHLPGLRWIIEHESEIRQKAAALQLLCMFRPNSAGLDFGDGMYLDFLIHREALATRDFSQIHCTLPMLL